MKLRTPFDGDRYEMRNIVGEKLASAPAAPVTGLRYFDTTIGAERVYDGANWETLPAPWTAYTPTATATAGFVLGNGTVAGRYQIIGRTVLLRLLFVVGSTTSPGTGPLLFTFPAGLVPVSTLGAVAPPCSGTAVIVAQGDTFLGTFVQHAAADTRLRVLTPGGAGGRGTWADGRLTSVQNADATGIIGTGRPFQPGALTFRAGDSVYLQGWYEHA